MIVAAQQPYFAPYSGFFLKAMLADVFVLMDSVQFPRGGTWLARNRFKDSVGTMWLSVPVWKKGLGLQKIDEVRICNERGWKRKHLESLKAAYGHAPFFEEHLPFLEMFLATDYERLTDLNLALIRYVFSVLGIHSRLVLLSEIEVNSKEPLLSVEVARRLGATHFLAQKSAGKYLNQNLFRQSGIEPIFFNRRRSAYPQLWSGFVANLSVLDLLFNCGPKSRKIISNELSERDRHFFIPFTAGPG
ncbi:MAG: hypothetical protein C4582_08395 [Desulfobacteraceae bacterium]|nr:MAG: hypothetical protein C4582_08395 [Desulfobacteraceae bacterium]